MTERTAIEDFWGQIDRQVEQHINNNAVKQIQVQITAVRVADQYVDVQRPGNPASDGVYYPVIAPAYKPRVADWVWAQVTQGGLLIMGKNREPGDLDIPGAVSEAASDATTKANAAEADARTAAQTMANQAEADAKNYADNYKSPMNHDHDGRYAFGNHGHGSHWHGTQSIGGHSHVYQCWASTALWADTYRENRNSGTSGGHNHGGTDNSGV